MPTDEDEKKPEGGAEEEEGQDPGGGKGEERPTVAPPFDPVSFAKEILDNAPQSVRGPAWQGGPPSSGQNPHTKVTPAGGVRAPAPTYSDPDKLEEARRRSLEIVNRRATPTGALSVVNARVPSNLPPAATKPPVTKPPPIEHDSLIGMNAVDAEWADLEAATRPPPAGQNPEDFDIPSNRAPGADLSRLGAIARGSAPPEIPASEKRENEKKTAPPPAFVPEPEPDPFGSQNAGATPPSPIVEEEPSREERRPEKKSIREEGPPTEQEMNDRVSLGDYTGALAIAEKLLADDPGNVAVQACADNCRTVLRQMYVTKIGPLDRVPTVAVPRDQLRWLSIDHRAGFVLSLVDGVSSLEMILDVSGMPELDALRILSELAQQRIIAFR